MIRALDVLNVFVHVLVMCWRWYLGMDAKQVKLHLLLELRIVLDVRDPIESLPNADGIELRLRDKTTIEATIPKNRSLNSLFACLDSNGIQVISMRNKSNRLEELFMRLVEQDSSQ